jgi:hypothetical protein
MFYVIVAGIQDLAQNPVLKQIADVATVSGHFSLFGTRETGLAKMINDKG